MYHPKISNAGYRIKEQRSFSQENIAASEVIRQVYSLVISSRTSHDVFTQVTIWDRYVVTLV